MPEKPGTGGSGKHTNTFVVHFAPHPANNLVNTAGDMHRPVVGFVDPCVSESFYAKQPAVGGWRFNLLNFTRKMEYIRRGSEPQFSPAR